MIKQLKVIDTYSEGLSSGLPPGHCITPLEPINLVVGENGEGKTGFIRFIRTSLDYYIWWTLTGIGRIWSDLDLNSSDLAKSHYQYRRLSRQRGKILYRILRSDPEFELQDGELIERGKNLLFKKSLLARIEAEKPKLMGRKTPPNIWGFIEATIESEGILPFPVPLSFASKGFQFHYGSINSFLSEKDFLEADPLFESGNSEDDKWKIKCFGPLRDSERKMNPGSYIHEEIERYFTSLNKLGSSFTRASWQLGLKYDPQISNYAWSDEAKKNECIKRYGDRMLLLCPILLIDEPTNYLSYRNKYWFNGMLKSFIEKNNGTQAFIATNDGTLIEKIRGCNFINFDEKPAVCSSVYKI